MSIFLILAIIAALVRFLCWVLSKVPSKGPEPTWTTETLSDGSYNWTGKQASAATTHSPVQEVPESLAAESPEAVLITGEPETAVAHCTNCGAEIGAAWKFCRECGGALN